MPRALVLEPTRELADQVSESFDNYSKYSKLSHALLIGGVSMDEQVKKLDRGVDVLIATPGRLMDHFERGRILLSQVNILVIDEADRMLDMGFIPDVEKICKLLPFTRQTLFYSATMPPEIQRLTDQFLHNPVRIEVSRPATTAANITQQVVEIPANDWAKREALRRLIREAEPTLNNAIVFCNRKRDVDVVAKSLAKHGFDAAPIHGDLDQSVRMKTLEKFRSGELKILVASDVAARGLDVPSVSHVFNFDVPIHADDYVHRIGRTGRAGRSGTRLYAGLTSRRQIHRSHREDHRPEAGPPRDDGHRSARGQRPRRDHDRHGRGGKSGRTVGSQGPSPRPPSARRQVSRPGRQHGAGGSPSQRCRPGAEAPRPNRPQARTAPSKSRSTRPRGRESPWPRRDQGHRERHNAQRRGGGQERIARLPVPPRAGQEARAPDRIEPSRATCANAPVFLHFWRRNAPPFNAFYIAAEPD